MSTRNAKNTLWNSKSTDDKGFTIEHLAATYNFTFVNSSADSLDFVPPKTSFVDVRLCGDSVAVIKWIFLSFDSMSDHPLIYFEVQGNKVINKSRQASSFPFAPNIRLIDTSRYLNLLKKSSSLSPIALRTEQDINQAVDQLSCAIVSCANASRIRPCYKVPARNKPWWSKFLHALRSKLRTAYNR